VVSPQALTWRPFRPFRLARRVQCQSSESPVSLSARLRPLNAFRYHLAGHDGGGAGGGLQVESHTTSGPTKASIPHMLVKPATTAGQAMPSVPTHTAAPNVAYRPHTTKAGTPADNWHLVQSLRRPVESVLFTGLLWTYLYRSESPLVLPSGSSLMNRPTFGQ
jgi:hypothetical protein